MFHVHAHTLAPFQSRGKSFWRCPIEHVVVCSKPQQAAIAHSELNLLTYRWHTIRGDELRRGQPIHRVVDSGAQLSSLGVQAEADEDEGTYMLS